MKGPFLLGCLYPPSLGFQTSAGRLDKRDRPWAEPQPLLLIIMIIFNTIIINLLPLACLLAQLWHCPTCYRLQMFWCGAGSKTRGCIAQILLKNIFHFLFHAGRQVCFFFFLSLPFFGLIIQYFILNCRCYHYYYYICKKKCWRSL